LWSTGLNSISRYILSEQKQTHYLVAKLNP